MIESRRKDSIKAIISNEFSEDSLILQSHDIKKYYQKWYLDWIKCMMYDAANQGKQKID